MTSIQALDVLRSLLSVGPVLVPAMGPASCQVSDLSCLAVAVHGNSTAQLYLRATQWQRHLHLYLRCQGRRRDGISISGLSPQWEGIGYISVSRESMCYLCINSLVRYTSAPVLRPAS